MPSITSTLNPQLGQTIGFVLNGTLPAGQTFSEPVVSQLSGPAGTITQTLSVLGTAAADGSNTFKTQVSFTTLAASGVGDVVLACAVAGIDDVDFDFSVIAPPPGPETVTIDPASITVS